MKKNKFVTIFVLVFAVLMIAGCKEFWHPEPEDELNGDSGFIGDWAGIWTDGSNQTVLLTFRPNAWSMTVSASSWGFNGMYTVSGNIANLETLGTESFTGTAELSGDTLTLQYEYFTGDPIIMTRQ
jgi:hypothetical protein